MAKNHTAAQKVLVDPKARRRLLFTVAFTLFLDLAGFGIILPILPLYAEKLGGGAIVVALLSTAFSLAQFVMSPVLGSLSDRAGRRPVMLLSILGSVLANLVLGFSMHIGLVFAARVVAGASKANVSTAYAYVADVVEPKERAKYMGMMGAALGMGFVVGPAIGGLLSTPEMPTLPFFVSAALSLVNLLMAWMWLPETRFLRDEAGDAERRAENGGSRRPGPFELYRKVRGTLLGRLVLVNFLFFSSFAAMESTFALYNKGVFGWLEKETGFYLTYVGVVMVFVQGMAIGRVVERIGESRTMVMGIAANVVGLLAMGLVPFVALELGYPLTTADGGITWVSALTLGLSGLGLAVGNGFLNATMGAIISQISDKDEQGINMGVRESAGALARICGPIFAGPAFEFIYPGAPMVVGALFGVANLMLLASLMSELRARGVR
jgi:multidrug resistance protein